jgi:transposase
VTELFFDDGDDAILTAPYFSFRAPLGTRPDAVPGAGKRRSIRSRLLREICEQGYAAGHTVGDGLSREVRPAPRPPFEVRLETPPGHQAQADFAQFQVVFTDEFGLPLGAPVYQEETCARGAEGPVQRSSC